MSVRLNHAIVFAEDKDESASFFTTLFGLPEASSWGPFRIVELDNDGSILFAEPGVEIQPQHLAFLVSEVDFDGIYGRIVEDKLERWADPRKSAPGTFNTNNYGRGVYFNDPAGHNLEVLTRTDRSGGYIPRTTPGVTRTPGASRNVSVDKAAVPAFGPTHRVTRRRKGAAQSSL